MALPLEHPIATRRPTADRSRRQQPKPRDATGPRLDEQLCFPLYAAARLVVQAYTPLLRKLHLTYPQYLVLMVLWEADGASVQQIGERLYLDSGTLTPLLKRLEANGLVARIRDVGDERRVHINLTPSGRRLKARAASVPACLLAASQCSLDELVSLTQQMQQLRDRIKAA